MSLDSLRDRVTALLRQADPEAQVHDYERWTNDPQTVLALFKATLADDQHLHAWVLKPVSAQTVHYTQTDDLVTYVFLFRFIYSLVDAEASEQAAWRIVEQVRRVFRNHPTLADAVDLAASADDSPLRGKPGLQIEKLEVLTFANVLVHYGEARLAVASVEPLSA